MQSHGEHFSSVVTSLIKDVYDHPDMYGLTAFEIEATLFTLHAVFSQLENLSVEFSEIRSKVMTDDDRRYGGYVRGYLKDYFPGGQDITNVAVKIYVLEKFKLISKALRIE